MQRILKSQIKNPAIYDNFVLLRLLMAIFVMVAHFEVLSDMDYIIWVQIPNCAPQFAIGSFFIISGYVILASFDKLPAAKSFFTKRFFRMYPLYAFIIIVQTIIMILFFVDDISAQIPSIIKYFTANMLMLNFIVPAIGNLFSGGINPAVNPSLWTLKIEMMFYISVPIIYFLYKRFNWAVLALIFIGSTIFHFLMLHLGKDELAKQLPGELRFIIIGSILYFWRGKLDVSIPFAIFFSASGVILTTFFYDKIPTSIYPIFLGLVIIIAAIKIPMWRPKTDLSYGVFLIHAPLIQFSILLGVFHHSFWFLGGLFIVSCGLAYLGYHFIEAPCVALGQKISKIITLKKDQTALVTINNNN